MKNTGLLLTICFFAISCSEIIEYSPYDTDVKNETLNLVYGENLNSHQFINFDTLTFAFFSDPHYYYDQLAAAVKSINNQKRIAFVVIGGDITHGGLAKEYQYFRKQVGKLRHPFITVIGNHDFLSNGYVVYKRMFGNPNFSFSCGEYKFITFNSVVWENNNIRPDFEWLSQEVEKTDQRCIILSHIPPWTDQFNDEYRNKYYDIAAHPRVALSVHGHQHHYHDTLVNNKRYLVSEAVYEREYYLVHLFKGNIEIEQVKF